MKRASENGESKEFVKKKVRVIDGIDQNFELDINEGEEESDLAENGGVHSELVCKNGMTFGNVVTDNLDGPSLGGVEGFGEWDFDINFDMIFGCEEQQKGVALDLNVPLYNTYPSNRNTSLLASDQYPNNRNNSLLACDRYPNRQIYSNGKEVVDLVSDDDGSDVEIIGYTNGYNLHHEQVESGMPNDPEEKLSLGLGLLSMDNGVGKSSPVRGECSYAREERGKGSDMDSWLSLKASYLVDLDPDSDSDEPIELIKPPEVVVDIPRQPEVLAAVPEMSERELGYRRDIARQLARVNFSDPISGEKQKLPTPNPIEQLGKLPGPFCDALKMVRERVPKRAAEPLITWRPFVENQEQSVTAAFVPSLLNLSLKALAGSAEGIVSLDQVPDNLRGRLTNRLCDIGKIDAHFLNLLVEGCPTEIRIKNCSWITEEQFQQTIGKCRTKNLRVLQLDLCGQCMLDIDFKNILNRCLSSFSRLVIMSLRGACRLSDNGLKVLVMAAPLLRSINLGQCSLLTSDAVNYIADLLGPNLRELYIDECLKIDAKLILPAFTKLRYLEVLSVAELHTINDQFVKGLVTACGRSLKELDFANCRQLTDYSLKFIGDGCSDLCSLNISNLDNLTDVGLEYLANGCRSIQNLKLRCNDFSDEALAAFLESSGGSLLELLLNNMAKVGPHTALSLAKCSRKLMSLDIAWCRRISNEALGLIVDSCSSLKLLKVFGCRQITKEFLEGHSNPFVRIIGMNFTPIMDHLDLLEPEEVFLKYSPLPVNMEDNILNTLS